MAKLETAIRTVIDFNKAFNHHDVPALLALVSEDCFFVNPDPFTEAASYSGRETLFRFWDHFFAVHPRAQMDIEELFGFSIHCVMRWRFDYVDSAGASRQLQGVDLFRIKNGLICEKLTYLKK
jgi:ketosteroid isomerase-like protein